jgi:excinuclease ABC subunit A
MMGPGSGKEGGSILYQGDPKNYFKKSEKFETKVVKKSQRYPEFIDVKKPSIFGKTYSDIKIPIHDLTWVKGSSGTGKTATLIKILGNSLYHDIHQEWLDESEFSVESIHSPVQFEDILIISSELNRFTSRSSVGTLTELAPVIRKHFLKLPMVKSMGLKEGHLSSNSELGMCSRCEGRGSLLIEMQYLEDIVLECEECKGLKIKPLYAQISDGRMTLAEAYNLPLNQVLSHIDLTPKFRRVWEYIKILNLDYLSLDRSLNSLSGGEKQRIYLLSRLLKSVQNSLLIFENISFGLSVRELSSLGTFLQEMSLFQNTILVIDSSPVFKNLASWQLDFDTKKINLLPLR